jgi:hypothetical protein
VCDRLSNLFGDLANKSESTCNKVGRALVISAVKIPGMHVACLTFPKRLTEALSKSSHPLMTNELRDQLGPLAPLVGIWEGDKGDDIAPSDDRGTENNKYRERITFEQVGPIQNHEQNLHVLRYSTRASRLGEQNTFHEELGYWSWEPANNEVMRSFLIPRGIALIAGGYAEKNADGFHLEAKNGSSTFGICVNPFLNREFKIISYELTVKIHDENSFSYEQDTVIQIPGQKDVFHHRDRNTLKRVG